MRDAAIPGRIGRPRGPGPSPLHFVVRARAKPFVIARPDRTKAPQEIFGRRRCWMSVQPDGDAQCRAAARRSDADRQNFMAANHMEDQGGVLVLTNRRAVGGGPAMRGGLRPCSARGRAGNSAFTATGRPGPGRFSICARPPAAPYCGAGRHEMNRFDRIPKTGHALQPLERVIKKRQDDRQRICKG